MWDVLPLPRAARRDFSSQRSALGYIVVAPFGAIASFGAISPFGRSGRLLRRMHRQMPFSFSSVS